MLGAFFGEAKQLGEVRKSELKEFSPWLAEKRKLKAKSINTALSAGTVAIRWAHAEELIPSNPAAGLVKFSGAAARRGVLAEEEVRRLFAVPWNNERAQVGNELAMSTGMREGEILAGQVRDIGDDRFFVRHSWSDLDGLKDTKTGKERIVPLLPSVRAALLELARKNPHGASPASFIFWSTERPDKPMDFHFLLDGLKDALIAMSLTEEEKKTPAKVEQVAQYWRSRKTVFHSWRHYYAARMADRISSRKVMLATGHSNGAVFESYANHRTEEIFQEVAATATEAFGDLVPFHS